MGEHLWWFLSRAAGVVTLFSSGTTVVIGLLMSTRLVRAKGFPKWLADLHPFLGTITLAALSAHLGALLLDGYTEFGVVDLVVPGASDWRTAAVAWGVVAAWVFMAVQLTSRMRKHMPRWAWQLVHRSSVLAFAASVAHAAQAGSDATNRVYVLGAVALSLAVCFLVIVRILDTSRSSGRVARSQKQPA